MVCEDWYHGRHLGADTIPEDRSQGHRATFTFTPTPSITPAPSSYAEMICRGCVARHSFLRHYTGLAVTRVAREGEAAKEGGGAREVVVDAEAAVGEGAAEAAVGGSAAGVATPAATCPLTLPAGAASTLFLPAGWRAGLCSCTSCSAAYTAAGVTFLTQEADTVHHYEQQVRLHIH